VIRYAKIHGTAHRPWLTALLALRPTKVAAIALANKIARMAWAMMIKGERYKRPAALIGGAGAIRSDRWPNSASAVDFLSSLPWSEAWSLDSFVSGVP